MHVRYMTYMSTPEHKNPCSGGHEIYNFNRIFLGHHYSLNVLTSLVDPCSGVEKK